MLERLSVIKEKIDKETLLWALAFIGTCTLVAMGKLKPETVEMFLFAILGRAATTKKEVQ